MRHSHSPDSQPGTLMHGDSRRSTFDQPTVLLVLFAVTTLGFMVLGGMIASCGILILSVGVAWLLYRRFPVAYVSFVWWLAFLVCFVRRLIDFRSGYFNQNVLLAAPLLAAMVCAPTLFERRVLWRQPIALPFVLGFASLLYGLGVGLLCLPARPLLVSSIGWFSPMIFGFYLLSEFVCANRGEEHIHSLTQTFCWGMLLMGAYGIYQYVTAPPWDALWMTGTEMNSIGTPEPFMVRVFSTMNAPGPLAYALVSGLLLVFCRGGILSAVSAALGFAALLLTSVRASWLAFSIALVLFLFKERKYARRVIIAGALAVAAFAGGLVVPPVRPAIENRMQTFTDLNDDASYQDRTEGYSQMLPYAEESPFGTGLGTMDAKFQEDTSLGARDSGIWEIFLSLGWIGGLVYLTALGLMVFRAWPRGTASAPFETAAACVSIGLLCQLPLGSVTLGVIGLTIWSFGAIAMARFAPAELRSRKGAPWLPDPASA